MRLRFSQVLSVVCLLISVTSCQVGHELHYFKSGNNYYRLKINESSFASKARYMSGFYDEKAVDRYFGEMSQPVESDSIKARDVYFFKTDAADYTADKLKIDSTKKLVMILSTNSNAIAEQIGAFAENDKILETIMRLNNKGKLAENSDLIRQLEFGKKRSLSTIALGTRYMEALADTASVAEVKSAMSSFLTYMQDLSKENATATELLLPTFKQR